MRGDELMNEKQGTFLLISLLAGAGAALFSAPVLANVEAECRQEAEDYGIPPEQLEDYVTGCVLSRGGNYTLDPAIPDYGIPGESGAADDAGTGSDYTDDAASDGSNLPE
jgi:hypothetical protein